MNAALDNIYQGAPHSPFSMSITAFENYRGFAVDRLLHWREEAGLASKLVACLLFAVLMALAAQVRLYLPFTPVPFTGQVLVVLLVGFVLGRFGTLSVGMYLGLGASFGWFSGQIGLAALSGVTAGYLLGFVIAAALIGEMAHRKRSWNLSRIVAGDERRSGDHPRLRLDMAGIPAAPRPGAGTAAGSTAVRGRGRDQGADGRFDRLSDNASTDPR